MFFLYDSSSGSIQQVSNASANPWPNPPASWAVLGPVSGDTADLAFLHPARYLILGSPPALVLQPYLTLAATENGGAWTLTATLYDPPATPPSSVTFAIGTSSLTAPLSSGVATLTVSLHPSVTTFAIPASVSATGVVSASTTFGGTQQPTIGLQCYQPASGNPVVAPVGPGSKVFLQAYYASQINPAQMPGDLATADALALHTLLAIVLPALQKANLITLDANQQNALSDMQTNLVPALPVTLENAYPSGGTRAQPYQQYLNDQEAAAKAFEAFAQDLAAIPNLA